MTYPPQRSHVGRSMLTAFMVVPPWGHSWRGMRRFWRPCLLPTPTGPEAAAWAGNESGGGDVEGGAVGVVESAGVVGAPLVVGDGGNGAFAFLVRHIPGV